MYLCQLTRYDISCAVNQLARAVSESSKVHMETSKHRLLLYLAAGEVDFGVSYKQRGVKLNVYLLWYCW